MRHEPARVKPPPELRYDTMCPGRGVSRRYDESGNGAVQSPPVAADSARDLAADPGGVPGPRAAVGRRPPAPDEPAGEAPGPRLPVRVLLVPPGAPVPLDAGLRRRSRRRDPRGRAVGRVRRE